MAILDSGRDAFRTASFFFGARIWLGTILGPFSINYFRGLGLRVRVKVWVSVRIRVRVGVSVVIYIEFSGLYGQCKFRLGSELGLGLRLGYGCKYVWGSAAACRRVERRDCAHEALSRLQSASSWLVMEQLVSGVCRLSCAFHAAGNSPPYVRRSDTGQ